MKFNYFLFVISILSFVACSSEGDDIALAKVGNKTLYYSDLDIFFSDEYSQDDSANIVDAMIQRWVLDELLFQKAEKSLTKEERDFKKQLEDYKKTLTVFEYEKQFIANNLDTIIDENEILAFYESNVENFQTKDNVLKIRYLKLLSSEKDNIKEQGKRLIFSYNKRDDAVLMSFVDKYAENYFIDVNIWLSYEDISKEIPLSESYTSDAMRAGRKIELTDDKYIYYLSILDSKMKEEVSILPDEYENVKQIILQKRKMNLMDSLHNSVYSDALRSGGLTIY